jgi:thiol-disulfide isomerase/thioredoxin
MKTWNSLLVAVALALPATAPARGQDKKVEVTVVSYAGLKEAVLKQRGSVVVVDFWADFCVPCKQNMPHLVELYNKHAKDGLAVITVSIDDVKKDPAVKGKLEKFLTARNATFTRNLLLDVPAEFWQKKTLRFESVPTVFVFDRRGRWELFTDDRFDPEVIDRRVAELLKEKP